MKFKVLMVLIFCSFAFSANSSPIILKDETKEILKQLFYECGKVSEQFAFASDRRTTALLDAMVDNIRRQFLISDRRISELKSRFFFGEVAFRSSVIGKKAYSPEWKFQSDELKEKVAVCFTI